MPDARRQGVLRRALRANALFTGASAVAAAALSGMLADEFAVRPLVLVAIGVALASYAAVLVAVASRPDIEPGLVRLIVGADVSWVIGTAVVLGGFAGSITSAGIVLLLAAAVVVGSFAIVQGRAMKALS